MAGRKKKATKLSLLRYKMKIGNIISQIPPTADIASEVMSEIYSSWETGFKTYVTVRKVIESVISDVPPSNRAPYYAMGQRYYNLVVARRHADPASRSAIRNALKEQAGADKDDGLVSGAKLDAVFDAIEKQYGIS